MLAQFESKRLLISTVQSTHFLLDGHIIELLTDRTTQYLPPHWRGIATPHQARGWIAERLKEGGVYALSLKETCGNTFIGFLFLQGINGSAKPREVRVGYILSEKYWGQGLVSELIASVVETLQINNTITAITGGVSPDNIASVKVLTKNGFIYTESSDTTDFYTYTY